MRIIGRATALLASLLSVACAGGFSMNRSQAPLYRLQSDKPSISVLSIETGNVDGSGPKEPGQLKASVLGAIQAYVASQHPTYTVVDDTGRGLKADFNIAVKPGELLPTATATLPALPAEVDSALVTAVYVMRVDQSTKPGFKEGTTVHHAESALAFATFTREGKLVGVEIISGEATGMNPGRPHMTREPNAPSLTSLYDNSDGRHSSGSTGFLPDDTDKLLEAITSYAVGLHYYPLFAHSVSESYPLAEDGPLKAGADAAKAGKLDEALAAWEQVLAADAKSAGALYDQAVVHVVRGEDDKALELLEKSIAAQDSSAAHTLLDDVKARQALQKQLP